MGKLVETTNCELCKKKSIRINIPPLDRNDMSTETLWWCACGARIPAGRIKIPKEMRPPKNSMSVFDEWPMDDAIKDIWEMEQRHNAHKRKKK